MPTTYVRVSPSSQRITLCQLHTLCTYVLYEQVRALFLLLRCARDNLLPLTLFFLKTSNQATLRISSTFILFYSCCNFGESVRTKRAFPLHKLQYLNIVCQEFSISTPSYHRFAYTASFFERPSRAPQQYHNRSTCFNVTYSCFKRPNPKIGMNTIAFNFHRFFHVWR